MKLYSGEVDILLIEDNIYDATMVKRSLQKVNLANNLIHAKDGVEAIEILFEKQENIQPKVILLDIKMPRLNGIQVLKKLRSEPKTRFIPVVMMTSSKEEKDVVSSYELGVNSYIVKPVESKSFSKTISDIVLYWVSVNLPPNSLYT